LKTECTYYKKLSKNKNSQITGFLDWCSRLRNTKEIKLNEISDCGLDLESRWNKVARKGHYWDSWKKLDIELIFNNNMQ
jgi:hypothetical protein